jgi:hypothetical protein
MVPFFADESSDVYHDDVICDWKNGAQVAASAGCAYQGQGEAAGPIPKSKTVR